MANKCKCGRNVLEGESGAVKVYDRARTLIKVLCPICATRSKVKKIKYFKRNRYSPDMFHNPEETL